MEWGMQFAIQIMNFWHIIMLLLTHTPWFCKANHLLDVLTQYDTLNKHDIQHKIARRSASQLKNTGHQRSVHFTSHGVKFHLKLTQSQGLLHPAFRASFVDSSGDESLISIDPDFFYEGYVDGASSTSHVSAHVSENGMMMATVELEEEIYTVEPMRRYMEKGSSPSHDMIVYRASDVKWNRTDTNEKDDNESHSKVCTSDTDESLDNNIAEPAENIDTYEEFQSMNPVLENFRHRRSVGDRLCPHDVSIVNNTCQMMLVADQKFYQEVGGGNQHVTILYMVQVINRVNSMFRRTCWGKVGMGIGLQVRDVKVNVDIPIYEEGNQEKLLESFSYEAKNWGSFCLLHLFTSHDFKKGVIGVAYIARPGTDVGICSLSFKNAGLTTHVNNGRMLTTLEAKLVTAHEIGHNFGAVHDEKFKASSKCVPTYEEGRYVMYGTSVSGEKTNNQQFSECSRRSVGDVLQSLQYRSSLCFQPEHQLCGNNVVDKEDGEECDSGFKDDHTCCDDRCRLRPHATCSDFNHICCVNCTIVTGNHTQVCRRGYTFECEGEIYCDGSSPDCPKTAPKLTSAEQCRLKNTSRKGKCSKDGTCTGLCELENLIPCSCSRDEEACQVCCRNHSTNSTCQPYKPQTSENNGVTCTIDGTEGICDNGNCTKYMTRFEEEKLTLNVILHAMKENIVLTILFFSLLLWVPASCVVRWSDQRHEREQRKLRDRVRDSFVGKGSSTSSDPRSTWGRGSTGSGEFNREAGEGLRRR